MPQHTAKTPLSAITLKATASWPSLQMSLSSTQGVIQRARHLGEGAEKAKECHFPRDLPLPIKLKR